MIDSFTGEHRFLSNFYPAVVIYECDRYPTVEHAYQTAKLGYRPDFDQMTNIRAMTAGQVKRWGRTIPIRDDWEQVKLSVMRDLLEQKFAPGLQLTSWLIRTYPYELIEGNTWGDTYWGVCNGKGKNHLGKLLGQIRFDRTSF